MKLCSAALLLTVCLAAPPALAAAPATGPKAEKVRRYLTLLGLEEQGRLVLQSAVADLNRGRSLPPGFSEKLRNLTEREDLLSLLVPVYAERLSDRDLDAAIAFYQSAAGRNLVRVQPELLHESGRLTQEWAARLTRKALDQVPNTPPPAVVLEAPIYRVPLEGRPALGSATARVTIVEFVDFQCPFCNRANNTLRELVQSYGTALRVVSRQNPLSFHKDALPAARAALAAHDQGQFWPMHDRLFGGQKDLSQQALEGHAVQLGLDLGRFREAMASERVRLTIDSDQALAKQLGALGTPTFFINGREFKGAQPLESFKRVIDAELQQADDALARGVHPADLYDELTRGGLNQAPPKPAAAARPKVEEDPSPVALRLPAWSPSAGPANAPVTLVVWTDLQCPFCARANATVAQVLKAYPKDVRFVWRHLPLAFHAHAQQAARASMAAHRQGRFFEYVDRVFAAQRDLSEATLGAIAQDLQLDVQRFQRDLTSPEVARQVEQDAKEAAAVGARGTPTFFVNGHRLVGAQPFAKFKEAIDRELAAR